MDTLRTHGSLLLQEQTTRVDALAQEVAERLTALTDQHRQTQTHQEALQQLLRQQGNPTLAYTVERVKEVMARNLTVARQQLDAIIQGQCPEQQRTV
jgi:hypothetical protein